MLRLGSFGIFAGITLFCTACQPDHLHSQRIARALMQGQASTPSARAEESQAKISSFSTTAQRLGLEITQASPQMFRDLPSFTHTQEWLLPLQNLSPTQQPELSEYESWNFERQQQWKHQTLLHLLRQQGLSESSSDELSQKILFRLNRDLTHCLIAREELDALHILLFHPSRTIKRLTSSADIFRRNGDLAFQAGLTLAALRLEREPFTVESSGIATLYRDPRRGWSLEIDPSGTARYRALPEAPIEPASCASQNFVEGETLTGIEDAP